MNDVIKMEKKDNFVYYNCISGFCPLIVEEHKYGLRISTCEDYCGNVGFCGCSSCAFEESELCNECIHK